MGGRSGSGPLRGELAGHLISGDDTEKPDRSAVFLSRSGWCTMRPMDTSSPASPYPRTYRVHRRARHAFRGIAFAFVVIVVIGDWLRTAGLNHRGGSDRRVMGILANIFLLAIAARFWTEANGRVTLCDDSIEVVRWASTRRVARSDIVARRIPHGGKGSWFHVLIPRDRNQPELKLPQSLATDAAFSAWLKPIPLIRRRRTRFPTLFRRS